MNLNYELATNTTTMYELDKVLSDIADSVEALDASRVAFKTFQPGAGPYGEPQLVAEVARRLNALTDYDSVKSKRTPDLLIVGHWALEFKIARPFGDNGREAENWSVNLLHPYAGNASVIGDCLKLQDLQCAERKAVVVIGFEHMPTVISLTPLLDAFEAVARHVTDISLGPRHELIRFGLVHPVHQCLRVVAWEVL